MNRDLLSLPYVVVAAMIWVPTVQGTEPIASFSRDGGWVEAKVSHDGDPLEGVTLRILTETGEKFGEGTTSSRGEATFPLPSGSKFFVEIKVGDKWADPIAVLKYDSVLMPTRVLLTYGLRPCCRGKISPTNPIPIEPPTPPREASLMPFAWTVACAVIGASAMQFWRRIRLSQQSVR